MWQLPEWDLLFPLALATVLGTVLTAIARPISHVLGMVDRPDGYRKKQAKPVPMLGGVAVYATFVIVLLGTAGSFLFEPTLSSTASLSATHIWAMLASATLCCLLGLLDDRFTLPAKQKLVLQFVAAIPFLIWGSTIENVSLLGAEFDVSSVGLLLTAIWLVGCVNTINLVDGMDGLAGSIAAIASGTLAVSAMNSGNTTTATIALVLMGALIGFLVHNRPPAKIYLGDAGSMTVGFLVGVLSLETSMKTTTSFTLAVPMVLLSVPIFDTFIAIVRRKLEGRSIGHADRRHIHHRLQDNGLSNSQALAVIIALCLLMAAASLASVYLKNDLIAVGVCLSMLAMLTASRLFGYDETVQLFRTMRAVTVLLLATPKLFRTRALLARLGPQDEVEPVELWRRICRHSQEAGCSELCVDLRDPLTGEVLVDLRWNESGPSTISSSTWQFQYSHQHTQNRMLRLHAGGKSPEGRMSPQVEECFRLLEAFSRIWQENSTRFLEAFQCSSSVEALRLPGILHDSSVFEHDGGGKHTTDFGRNAA